MLIVIHWGLGEGQRFLHGLLSYVFSLRRHHFSIPTMK